MTWLELTTAEAAQALGISPAGVRKLVERGQLEPLPHDGRQDRSRRFPAFDVERLAADRLDPAHRARLAALWEQVRTEGER